MGVLLHAQEDAQLDQLLKSIAAAHQGRVAVFAHNLKTGAIASLDPDEAVQTASTAHTGATFFAPARPTLQALVQAAQRRLATPP